jgi:hypothetical protein
VPRISLNFSVLYRDNGGRSASALAFSRILFDIAAEIARTQGA